MTLGKTTEVDLMADDISIIRSKNKGDHIGHIIQSVLNHMDNPEIIVVDNQSSDHTFRSYKIISA